jgi:DNA-binding NarL/FixJ family response regulator
VSLAGAAADRLVGPVEHDGDRILAAMPHRIAASMREVAMVRRTAVRNLCSSGARGYLPKGSDSDEVLTTNRERDVLAEIADGHDNATIARRLYISTITVSNNGFNILTKVHLADRSQAIVAAREAGLGSAHPPPRPS